MGRKRRARGSSPARWELEGSIVGGELGGDGCGRTWGRRGRRRCCGAVEADSSEERREREVGKLKESSVGHGGHRSGGPGGDLEQLGFALTENTYRGGSREEEEAAWGLCASERWMGTPLVLICSRGCSRARQASSCLPACFISVAHCQRKKKVKNPPTFWGIAGKSLLCIKLRKNMEERDLFGRFWRQGG